jgi:hypothetical protein
MNQNTAVFKSEKKHKKISQFIFGGIAFVAVGLIWMTQVQANNQFGFEFAKYNEQNSQLNETRQDLEVENARLKSLSSTKNSTVATTMSDPASVDTQQ